MGNHDFLCLPEWTDAEKILAKAEASQKRKAFTSGATSSHVAKRTRSALAQSSGSTTRPSLFVDNSDDGRWELFSAPAAEGPGTRDSRGKDIMVDDASAPSVGVSRPRSSSGPAPSFRDVFGDAIHMDFFPFSVGPYYATYPEEYLCGPLGLGKRASNVRIIWFSFGSFRGGSFGGVSFGSSAGSKGGLALTWSLTNTDATDSGPEPSFDRLAISESSVSTWRDLLGLSLGLRVVDRH
uniref:Uncharacterized protein n=1 Tax=Tanacetum cinerariifolium TaxID=118510 RepID=A0A6L2JWH3_TANCI|nr:hypothetical protein [Tanacetum cinerariifolium]